MWLDKTRGCQQSDADAYCKLKLCNVEAHAISFDIGGATKEPGFSCDNSGKNLGDWFGIKGVWFHEDVGTSNCGGTCTEGVVRNVKCNAPGMYNL